MASSTEVAACLELSVVAGRGGRSSGDGDDVLQLERSEISARKFPAGAHVNGEEDSRARVCGGGLPWPKFVDDGKVADGSGE